MRTSLLGVTAAAMVLSAGTDPKKTAREYPVHAVLEKAEIGAEYMVRSIPADGSPMAGDYLVVEVGIFPAKGQELKVGSEGFRFRINKETYGFSTASASAVAMEMKNPRWSQGYEPSTPVRPQQERFPGDPSARKRVPDAPRAPEDATFQKKPQKADWEWAEELALPEGPAKGPVSGLLYFPYKGSAKKIKAAWLEYEGPAGKATLKLM
jgi:hypothetical protein